MDAVILAAGRGTRVRALTPEFHKPLLPIDGVPLVCRAVDLAHRASVEWPVVVAAPENVEAISGALGDRDVVLVIQRRPKGPGHALLTGLMCHTRPVPSDRVLVLLSDNVVTDEDVQAVSAYETAVGVKQIDRTDVDRFTRYENGEWIERRTLGNLQGPPIPCWVGPFIGWRVNMERELHTLFNLTSEHELLIGPYLNRLMKDKKTNVIEVQSYDVGTLDSYPRGGITGGR